MSADGNKVPAGSDRMSASAYSVYSGKDGVSTGRDSMPGCRYKVPSHFDQMSAQSNFMLTDTYYV